MARRRTTAHLVVSRHCFQVLFPRVIKIGPLKFGRCRGNNKRGVGERKRSPGCRNSATRPRAYVMHGARAGRRRVVAERVEDEPAQRRLLGTADKDFRESFDVLLAAIASNSSHAICDDEHYPPTAISFLVPSSSSNLCDAASCSSVRVCCRLEKKKKEIGMKASQNEWVR